MDALAFYRVGRWFWTHRVPLVPRLMQGLGLVVFSASIPPSARIGRTAALGYGGLGVVVHARAIVGENTLLGPGVVIGGRSRLPEVPVIAGKDVHTRFAAVHVPYIQPGETRAEGEGEELVDGRVDAKARGRAWITNAGLGIGCGQHRRRYCDARCKPNPKR
jgi:hypothetical protein